MCHYLVYYEDMLSTEKNSDRMTVPKTDICSHSLLEIKEECYSIFRDFHCYSNLK